MAGFGTIEVLVLSPSDDVYAENIETGARLHTATLRVPSRDSAEHFWRDGRPRTEKRIRFQRVPVGEYWVWIHANYRDSEREWIRVFSDDVTVVDFRS